MSQDTVISGTERRRRLSEDDQRRILAAAFVPGVVVADVARKFDVATSLIYKWRRQAMSGKTDVAIAPAVLVTGTDAAPAQAAAAMTVALASGARIDIHTSASSALVAAVLRALR